MARIVSFCSTTGANTGGIDCDIRWGNPRMGFIGSAKFTPSEYATEVTLKAAIQNRIKRANGDTEKLYPLPIINTVTNNTEAATTETLGDGTIRTLREGRPSYTFESGFVGLNQEAALMEFNNSTIPFFILDDTGKLGGKFDADDNFVGARVQFVATPAGLGTYAAGTTTKMSVNYLNSRDLSSNAKLFETSFDTDDFEGLLDAELRTLVAPTGNAHKIGVYVTNKSIGKDKNLYSEYSAELADADLWEGETPAGAIVAPTTVVADAVNLGWTVTFGVPVAIIRLKDPVTLDAADVVGIESIDLAV